MGTITRNFANLITANGPSAVADGTIVNDDINASAAIVTTKFASTGTLTIDNIQFPATRVASADANNLDDFEEGTWTPTYVSAATNFSSVTYEQQVGKYTKIGRMVFLTVTISTSAITKGSAAGDVVIAGLPFAPDSNFSNATTLNATVNWAGDIPIGWTLFSGNNSLYLYYKSGTSSLNINPDDLGTGGSANNFIATMIYTTTG